ncbi:toprim domain-containing protein [Dorea formicigenerans]
MQYFADHKNIRKIYLCLDNDTAGNAACEKRV